MHFADAIGLAKVADCAATGRGFNDTNDTA